MYKLIHSLHPTSINNVKSRLEEDLGEEIPDEMFTLHLSVRGTG